MHHSHLSTGTTFLQRVCEVEESLFSDLFDPDDSKRMKNNGQYSWLYRPSHHIKTGLVTEKDMSALETNRLLSVGAFPAMLESVMCSLGVPAKNITVADFNPTILTLQNDMQKQAFDMTRCWPDVGMFHLIIFPESLCIALGTSHDLKEEYCETILFPQDEQQSELLAHILSEALTRLHSHGEIRANGPMCHPNVVRATRTILKQKGIDHSITYERFFLIVRH